jgi:hypothetical protein
MQMVADAAMGANETMSAGSLEVTQIVLGLKKALKYPAGA